MLMPPAAFQFSAVLKMLDHITPVLLTYNEEQNVGRTLSHLAWASDIVVVDGGSTDGTLAVSQPTYWKKDDGNFPRWPAADRL
jgi:hypothetical protein